MEETLVLKGQKREGIGSKAAAKLRRQGRIPAIVYGHKQEPVAISLDEHNLVEGVHHGHRLIDVQLGKKHQKVLIKDLQYDYIGKNITHVDLMRVDVSEKVKVTVPIHIKDAAKAKGAQEGGIIQELIDSLEVECKVTNIPESIAVSVKKLDIGDTLHAEDIELPEGVVLLTEPSVLVATCSVVIAKTAEEVEEEMPAAPEVIGEVKEGEQKEKSAEEESK